MPTGPESTLACLVVAGLLALSPSARATSASGASVIPGCVRLLDSGGETIGRARIVRSVLTPDELSAPFSFSVSLRMRDFAGLQARIASGAHVSRLELEARYLPLRADYGRVAAWLASQGFTQSMEDLSHTSVFVRGSAADVARVFGVRLARVAVSDGEYTSAVSEPSMPSGISPVVLSVNGLQPQFRMRHFKTAVRPAPMDAVGTEVFVTPDNVVSAYNVPASATGAGQIIAIVDQASVLNSDLSTFWTTTGVAQVPGNVTTIGVNGGAIDNPSDGALRETALDVQWAGAIAPAAGIRLYLSSDVFDCFAQIQNDAASFPAMTVLSVSYGATEDSEGESVLAAFAQVMASMAATGMTIVASSGDAGSNPSGTGSTPVVYSASVPLGVDYLASDLSVTGVGGTTVNFTGNWAVSSEVVWDQITDTQSASGGGVSSYFARPPWQNGGSLLSGQTMRCVPDVAAIADSDLTNVILGGNFGPETVPDVGVLVYVNGMAEAVLGTSLACPVWAAIAAHINQARATAGLGPIGLLNPYLYPFAGTSVFNDVTSGTNGAYTAGPGYDLCTGLGTPNVANLLAALGGQGGSNRRLVNLSARVQVGTGANIVIAGFVIQGPAGTTKDILVRGAGPGLTAFGVSGVLANPIVGVYDLAGALIATDTGWGNSPTAGASKVGATFRQATLNDMMATGAFAFQAGSADSAMVLTLPVGNYTMQVSGSGATTGVALSEVYELNSSSPEVLVNISSRCFVGTGAQVAISGFVVQGKQAAQLLIRGVGPALDGFGLSGALARPSIGLYDSTTTLVASNTGWGNPLLAGTSGMAATYRQATAADMLAVGAFALGANSADSAMVVILPPGSYTAVVSGVGGSTGTALAEVYEMSEL